MRTTCLSLLVSGAVAREQLQHSFTASDICYWSPLLSDTTSSFCQASLLRKFRPAASPDARSRKNATQGTTYPNVWEGPSHCWEGLCVYSNKGFAGGIVLVTTPSNADKVKQITQNYQPSSSHKPSGDADTRPPPPYRAAHIPGKGTGLVATRRIEIGEPIMAQLPAVLVHRSFFAGGGAGAFSRAGHARILAAAVDELPAPRRALFASQAAQPGGDRYTSIMVTNSFQMNLGGGASGDEEAGHHFGNFPEVSRLNHDCRPNLIFRIAPDTMAHGTYATRPVAAGEELSISYIDLFLPQAERRAQLQLSWGFRCSCAACTGRDINDHNNGGGGAAVARDHHEGGEQEEEGEYEDDEAAIARSDSRLREIERLEAQLSDLQSANITPAVVDRLVHLYERERLDAKAAGGWTVAAMNYAMLGQEDKARRLAGMAARAVALEYGEDAPDAVVMRDLARNPKGHWTWNARVGRKA